MPGHGRDNPQHELELGDAWVTSARAADVVRNALAVADRIKPAADGPGQAEARRSRGGWEDAFSAALAGLGL